jgi:hypothetical protein
MVDVILQGYVFGSRCPGVVKAELASIEEQWQRALAASGDDSDSLRAATGFVTAWHTFLRESVLALVPGLTPGEADVLAAVPPGEEGPATALLRYLGLSRPGAEEEGEEASPQPVGDESTTASLSPTSSPSTTSDPPIC